MLIVAPDDATDAIRAAWHSLPWPSRPHLAGRVPDRDSLTLPDGHFGVATPHDPVRFPLAYNPPLRLPCDGPPSPAALDAHDTWLAGLVLARFAGEVVERLSAILKYGPTQWAFFDIASLAIMDDDRLRALSQLLPCHRVIALVDPSDMPRLV